MLADAEHPLDQLIQENGEMPVPPADPDLVHCQKSEALEIGSPGSTPQKGLVDTVDHSPSQSQVLSDIHCYYLTPFMDILGRALGDSEVGGGITPDPR